MDGCCGDSGECFYTKCREINWWPSQISVLQDLAQNGMYRCVYIYVHIRWG